MAKPRLVEELTAEQLRSVLHYDPETGIFRWREDIPHQRAGMVAGTKSRGHLVVGLGTTHKTDQRRVFVLGTKKRVYFLHRLAWLYVHGHWPDGEIDHKNTDGFDNRWSNLRESTFRQNRCNTRKRGDNTSGFKGVSWLKRDAKWVAHITHWNVTHHLGVFDTPEAAHAAYCEAAKRLHGDFARNE